MVTGLLVKGARLLTATLPSRAVVDRETVRTRFLVAALGAIAAVLAVPGPAPQRPTLLAVAVAVVVATAVASAVPACWPVLNRFGGVLIAAEIALLVAATGGPTSPFNALYTILLVYAAMFYPARRLVGIAAVLLVLFVTPHAMLVGQHDGHWRPVAAVVGVWIVLAAVVHGLMTQLRARAADLDRSEQRYRALFDQNADAILSLDPRGRVTAVNAAGAELAALSPAEALGRPYADFVADADTEAAGQMLADALGGGTAEGVLRVVRADGGVVVGAVKGVPVVVDDAVVGVHVVVKDITEVTALQDRLAHQALHDPLTGLANRTLLADRLDQHREAAARTGASVAALVIDLDGFKGVNDTHGHDAGDALLVDVAERMSTSLRGQDTLARIGGDEFAVLLPDADEQVAHRIAQRLRDVAGQPTRFGDAELRVTASVGVAVSGDGFDDLLSRADRSMYAEKLG